VNTDKKVCCYRIPEFSIQLLLITRLVNMVIDQYLNTSITKEELRCLRVQY